MKALLGLLLLVGVAGAQDLPEHPRDLSIPPLAPYSPPVPERYQIEGGPGLTLLPDSRLPLVDGIALFQIGTGLDPEGKAGLVELLVEGIRTGGSANMEVQELDRWLDSHGAVLELKAEPELLRVEFSCLSEHAAQLLEILRDLLRSPQLPEAALDKARAKLISASEREQDDTSALADRMLLRAAYGADSSYARVRRSEELEKISREDLLAFHRAQFGSDRLLLGLTGNLAPASTSELVGTLFKGWKAAEPPKKPMAPAFLQPRSRVVHVIDRPGVTQTELRLTSPGVRRLHPDYAALYLWSHAIGAGGAANRMMMEVRTGLGLAYTVGAFYRAGWSKAGRFEAWCGTRNDSVAEALTAMLSVLDKGKLPFSEEELQAVRSRVLNGRVFEVDSSIEVLEQHLLLEFYGYPDDFQLQLEEKLRALTSEDIAAAIGRHLDTERLIIIAVGPAEEIEESLADFGELLPLDASGAPRAASLPAAASKLLANLGGAEGWAKLETLHRKGVMSIPTGSGAIEVPREYWQSMSPNQSRTDVVVSGAKTSIVLTPESCFSLSAGQIQDLPADQCQIRRAKSDGNIYRLLHLIALGEFSSVTESGAGKLEVRLASGLVCTLELTESGLPRSLESQFMGSVETWEYDDWKPAGNLFWFGSARERNLGTEVSTELFEPDSELAEDLFRDPRQ